MRQYSSDNPEDRLRNIEAGLTRAREVSFKIEYTIAEKKIHPLLKSYEVKCPFSNGRGRP